MTERAIKLLSKYEAKAKIAYENYQNSGLRKYLNEYEKLNYLIRAIEFYEDEMQKRKNNV